VHRDGTAFVLAVMARVSTEMVALLVLMAVFWVAEVTSVMDRLTRMTLMMMHVVSSAGYSTAHHPDSDPLGSQA
jgi:hypothetical protein